MTRSILIGDGDPASRTILQLVLESEGFSVTAAASGEEVLRALDHCRPDAILLETTLPGPSGYEICETLRSRGNGSRVPVVFLSTKARPLDIEKGLAVGAAAYVTKPFSIQAVVAKLQDLASQPHHDAA